jgi:hypothetical protein
MASSRAIRATGQAAERCALGYETQKEKGRI